MLHGFREFGTRRIIVNFFFVIMFGGTRVSRASHLTPTK